MASCKTAKALGDTAVLLQAINIVRRALIQYKDIILPV